MSGSSKAGKWRKQQILDLLSQQPNVYTKDICTRLGVSEVTIRHDLAELENAGKLRRVRGGAVSLTRSISIGYPEERLRSNVRGKDQIAQVATTLIDPGDVIIIDIGTTGLQLCHHLSEIDGITIITADLAIANYATLNLPKANVMVPGGAIRKGYLYLAGSLTIDTMSQLYVDKAFICSDGFTADHGFTVEHDFSVSIKKIYTTNARKRYMMLDSSKIGKTSFFHLSDLPAYDAIVVDSDPDGSMTDACSALPQPPRLLIADQLLSSAKLRL